MNYVKIDNPFEIDDILDVLITIIPSPVFLFLNKASNRVCKNMLNKYENLVDQYYENTDINTPHPCIDPILNGNLLLLKEYGWTVNNKMDNPIAKIASEDYYVKALSKYFRGDIPNYLHDNLIWNSIDKGSLIWKLIYYAKKPTNIDVGIILRCIYRKHSEAMGYFWDLFKQSCERYSENLFEVHCLELLATAIDQNWEEVIKILPKVCFEHVIVYCDKYPTPNKEIQMLLSNTFCGVCKKLAASHFKDSCLKMFETQYQSLLETALSCLEHQPNYQIFSTFSLLGHRIWQKHEVECLQQ